MHVNIPSARTGPEGSVTVCNLNLKKCAEGTMSHLSALNVLPQCPHQPRSADKLEPHTQNSRLDPPEPPAKVSPAITVKVSHLQVCLSKMEHRSWVERAGHVCLPH